MDRKIVSFRNDVWEDILKKFAYFPIQISDRYEIYFLNPYATHHGIESFEIRNRFGNLSNLPILNNLLSNFWKFATLNRVEIFILLECMLMLWLHAEFTTKLNCKDLLNSLLVAFLKSLLLKWQSLSRHLNYTTHYYLSLEEKFGACLWSSLDR